MKSLATVDSYLAALPAKDRNVLQKIRQTIKQAAPQAEEKISYGIPGYIWNGPVVYFAGFKDHLSLFGINRDLINKLAKPSAHYKIKGTTIHFWADKPLPASLIKALVKARLKANAARKKSARR